LQKQAAAGTPDNPKLKKQHSSGREGVEGQNTRFLNLTEKETTKLAEGMGRAHLSEKKKGGGGKVSEGQASRVHESAGALKNCWC